jgi:uncharacterized repeat protein (TIGR03806 family)
MKKYYSIAFVLFLLIAIFISCSKSDDEQYIPISQVNVNLASVPFVKLSDYHFFDGELKNQNPSLNVIPYEPASSLFSDYAHKKRFVWMPTGTHATYVSDDNVFDFPIGSVLIKTFYYDNVQPGNTSKLLETRLLIRVEGYKETPTIIGTTLVNVKSSGWQLYDYIWNAEQTEATLETTGNGLVIPVTWIENGVTKSVNYNVPSATQCVTCHKNNTTNTSGGELTIPIGPKPQNLNTNYNYSGTSINQITKWKNAGYLGNDIPATINATVDWRDTSKSLELRARSYIDINCAHCHRTGGHCDYVAQRFNFSNTDLHTFGVCLTPLFNVQNLPFVINGGNAMNSEMIYRMSSVQSAEMMPYIGRTVVHEEGVQLMKDWINSLPVNCH